MSEADDLYRDLGVEPDDPGVEPDDLGVEPDETAAGDGADAGPAAVTPETLEALGGHLVWKVGKEDVTGRVVVRVGYATATRSFADLPRLHGATDPELTEAARRGELVVEWIE